MDRWGTPSTMAVLFGLVFQRIHHIYIRIYMVETGSIAWRFERWRSRNHVVSFCSVEVMGT